MSTTVRLLSSAATMLTGCGARSDGYSGVKNAPSMPRQKVATASAARLVAMIRRQPRPAWAPGHSSATQTTTICSARPVLAQPTRNG